MKLEIVFKDGRKETFDCVASFNVTEEQANEECHASEAVQAPTEGKPFEVNPLGIDRSKFEKTMSDRQQERTRQIILEAFAEVDKHPEKYASSFYTLIPEKKWYDKKTYAELEVYANDLGGVVADWVEQALEWAQRICNGESWEDICNKRDTANYLRAILWKNGYYRLIGGTRKYCDWPRYPASNIDGYQYKSNNRCDFVVPLIMIKKK